jgi:hypothetical protein
MKIIFLDIDGVMNCAKYAKYLYRSGHPGLRMRRFPPTAIRALNWLLEDESIKIVISSTWRKYWDIEDLRKHFEKQGASTSNRIIGYTPVFYNKPRGDEIEAWINSHSVSNFVILDDDSDMGNVKSNFVKTSNRYGLTMKHARKAKEILNKKVGVQSYE